ncbi:unnamed protein product [Meganyctiphanes norvegica]|uniref:Chitin-binding type-2 domain-containing protein n=1 Tax=Meganyctiphanes norvegica TaxID=48144 RepID=A0AAV2PLT5_MEGNR
MGILPITLALFTVVSAFPRTPGRTRSQQQISAYFPDTRYPDQMINPSFMTAKCVSEGVFPHPYNCAWVYRCHDQTAEGFFHTSYFICAPGTEFDDDLDQCITKSGTCGNCTTLPSSCHSCNGRQAAQVFCEFQECYSGDRVTGIQRICAPGQLHDGQNCVEDAKCPCTVDKAKFWGDCTDVTRCSSNDQIERTEKQCNPYSCSITGQEMSCENGQVFSPDQRTCVELLNDAWCPCTADRAKFWGDCVDANGCSEGSQLNTTEKQCTLFSCSNTGQEIRCENGQVFSPDQRACVEPLNEAKCPCTVDRAKFWGDCINVIRCSETQCNHYSCSIRGQEMSCENGQVFIPDQRTCVEPIHECANCPASDTISTTACSTYCIDGQPKEAKIVQEMSSQRELGIVAHLKMLTGGTIVLLQMHVQVTNTLNNFGNSRCNNRFNNRCNRCNNRCNNRLNSGKNRCSNKCNSKCNICSSSKRYARNILVKKMDLNSCVTMVKCLTLRKRHALNPSQTLSVETYFLTLQCLRDSLNTVHQN